MKDDTVTRSIKPSRRRTDRPNHHPACLVIIRGPSIGEKFSLSKERMVIGRKKEAEIWIEDGSVSRHHAEIFILGNDFILHDSGSKNGTYCNDEKITEKILQEGDILRVGDVVLKFLGPNSIEQGYHSKISDQAQRDGLTGLFNKQMFQTSLERILARCSDLHEPLSLLMLDIDHFKRINDTWGHPAGDYVLKEFAGLTARQIRPTDFLARWGGEEFALILPHTRVKEGEIVAERIRNQSAAHRFVFDGHSFPVTVSIGLTEWTDTLETPAALLARADKALYQAKQNGRNRVCSVTAAPP